MKINTRFTVAIHILTLVALSDVQPSTSKMMATSVGSHPVVIRQIITLLKKAGLVTTRSGLPGAKLARSPKDITLRDIYRAVKDDDSSVFDIHPNPNPECPVGCNIVSALDTPLTHAQNAMEHALEEYTLNDITEYIVEKNS